MTQFANQNPPTVQEIAMWDKQLKKQHQNGILGNYIFVKAFTTRIKATGIGRASEGEGDGKITVSYKKGDIVKGKMINNTINTGVANVPYIIVLKNGVKIPFKGNSEEILKPYFKAEMPKSNFPISEELKDKIISELKDTAKEVKKQITIKNVAMATVGFLALVGLIKIIK